MSDLKKYLNVYEFDTNLPGSGVEVKYKGLSTNLMKKLLIFENEKDPLKEEEIFDFLLKEVVLNDVDVNDMYTLDRYFLFIKVRIATKGSLYQYTYTCPHCKSQSLQSIDLDQMMVKKPKMLKKDRVLKLVNDQIIFEMDYPKRSTQKNVYKHISRRLSDSEKVIDIRLADIVSHITKVTTPDGDQELDVKELIDFVGDLPEKELDVIRDWQKKFHFGIDLTHINVCNGCKEEEERLIPLTNFFS